MISGTKSDNQIKCEDLAFQVLGNILVLRLEGRSLSQVLHSSPTGSLLTHVKRDSNSHTKR